MYGDAQGRDQHLTTRDEPVAICSVAWIELADYAKKPVREQMRLNAALSELLTHALAGRPAVERIVLDTGEGAAVVFPHAPEQCLLFGFALCAALEARSDDAPLLRIGMNFGPLRFVRGNDGQPAFMGDGLAAAQRIAGFAQSKQVVASRSFYEAIAAVRAQCASCFAFEGTRTDSDVREHYVYSLREGRSPVRGLLPRSQGRPIASVARTFSSAANVLRARVARKPAVATALAVALILALAFGLRPEPQETLPGSVDASPSPLPAPARAQAAPPTAPDSDIAAATDANVQAEAELAMTPQTALPPSLQESAPEPPTVFTPRTQLRTEAASAVLSKPAPSPPPKPAAKPALRQAAVAADSPPQPQPSDQAAATGAVRLTIVPWGEIYLDGEKLGVAPPLRDVVLEPGVYRFEIRNPGFASLMRVVEVAPGEEVRIRHRFD